MLASSCNMHRLLPVLDQIKILFMLRAHFKNHPHGKLPGCSLRYLPSPSCMPNSLCPGPVGIAGFLPDTLALAQKNQPPTNKETALPKIALQCAQLLRHLPGIPLPNSPPSFQYLEYLIPNISFGPSDPGDCLDLVDMTPT